MKTFFSSLALATSLLVTSTSFASDATGLAPQIRAVKVKLDQILSQAGVHSGPGRSGGGGGGGGGGGHGPWFPNDSLNENDLLATPIMLDASMSLDQASIAADQAVFFALSGNPQASLVQFTRACMNMSLSRSKISRANLAALQPPLGFISSFGPDLTDFVVEIQNLRTAYSCP